MKKTVKRSGVLRKTRRRFASWKKANGNRQGEVPAGLRELVLSGLNEGYPPRRIATAAGISQQSIANWWKLATRNGARGRERVVELKVVDERQVVREIAAQGASDTAAAATAARITLKSGVMIEIPISSLNAGLLRTFLRGIVWIFAAGTRGFWRKPTP